MKNKEQLKNAFKRFPKVDVLYSDGERIYAKQTEGAKKVTRSEVFDAGPKAKANAEVKTNAEPKADEEPKVKAAAASKKTKSKNE